MTTKIEPARTVRASSIRRTAGPVEVDLALGRPSWPMASSGFQALGHLGGCDYGAHAGDLALRREIARHENVTADEVLITSGAQGALFAIVHAFVGAGDPVLVPDPGFPAYRTLVELAGGRVLTYPSAERTHDLDAAALIDVLEGVRGVALVILNHPANPTGGRADRRALRQVADACAERGVLVVADEVYRPLVEEEPSLRRVTDAGLVIGSMSKAWAAPGLRLGWVTGNPALLASCREIHALMSTHAAVPSQAAATALLHDRLALRESRRQLARRRRAFEEAWRTHMKTVPPRHRGFYAWLDLAVDDLEFARRARSQGLAVVPGSVFGAGGRGHIRLSLGAPPTTIREGVRRLRRVLDATGPPQTPNRFPRCVP